MSAKRAPLSRSEVMARVKGKDTKPELRVRRALHGAGLRYRLHAKELPGRPDIVFRAARLAIFVHGCFWHRHPGCPHARMPKSRLEFWQPKLAANAKRDAARAGELEATGWMVMTVWECETRDEGALRRVVDSVRGLIKSNGEGGDGAKAEEAANHAR